MDEEPENTPRNGGNASTSVVSQPSGQLLTNETMNRMTERTCTQKLTIPTLEKQEHTNANLWWRKFVQYKKMTKDIDLSTMTNTKELLPQYSDQLERVHRSQWKKEKLTPKRTKTPQSWRYRR